MSKSHRQHRKTDGNGSDRHTTGRMSAVPGGSSVHGGNKKEQQSTATSQGKKRRMMQWLFTEEEMVNVPSLAVMTVQNELEQRRKATTFVQEMGAQLKLYVQAWYEEVV